MDFAKIVKKSTLMVGVLFTVSSGCINTPEDRDNNCLHEWVIDSFRNWACGCLNESAHESFLQMINWTPLINTATKQETAYMKYWIIHSTDLFENTDLFTSQRCGTVFKHGSQTRFVLPGMSCWTFGRTHHKIFYRILIIRTFCWIL